MLLGKQIFKGDKDYSIKKLKCYEITKVKIILESLRYNPTFFPKTQI